MIKAVRVQCEPVAPWAQGMGTGGELPMGQGLEARPVPPPPAGQQGRMGLEQ